MTVSMCLKYQVDPTCSPVELQKFWRIGIKFEHPKRILTVGGKKSLSEEMLQIITDCYAPQHLPQPNHLANGFVKFKLRVGYKKFVYSIQYLKEHANYEITPISNFEGIWR